MIGNPDSKYSNKTRSLDADMIDKQIKQKELTMSLSDLIINALKENVKYNDGNVATIDVKYRCLIEAVKEVKKKFNLR